LGKHRILYNLLYILFGGNISFVIRREAAITC